MPGDVRLVIGFELGWWDEPDLAVKASMVEPVDVLGDGDLDVGHALPTSHGSGDMVADRLGLEQRVERSAIALSKLSPLLPTLATASASASRSVYRTARYWAVVMGQPGDVVAGSLPCPQTPMSRAAAAGARADLHAVVSRHMFVWLTHSQTLAAVVAGCEAA